MSSSIKKYKIRDHCISKLSKEILKLLRVQRGKLTLGPPPEEFAPTDNRQTSLSEPRGTHTQCL